jgi:hypothetical protein
MIESVDLVAKYSSGLADYLRMVRMKTNGGAMVKGLIYFTFLIVASCKNPETKLQDRAEDGRMKTGIFIPLSHAEYSESLAEPKQLSVDAFLQQVKAIVGRSDLQLNTEFGGFLVDTQADGSQLLSMYVNGALAPVLSLANGRLYRWSSVRGQNSLGQMVPTTLFFKQAWDTKESPKPNETFVLHVAKDDSSKSVAVLVPWSQHIQSEVQSNRDYFRIGNVVYRADTGGTSYRYLRLANDVDAWVMTGSYDDGEMSAGSIWIRTNGAYFSFNPVKQKWVKWLKQDGDSLDRIEVTGVPANLPAAVLSYIQSFRREEFLKDPRALSVKGFQPAYGDRNTYRLARGPVPNLAVPELETWENMKPKRSEQNIDGALGLTDTELESHPFGPGNSEVVKFSSTSLGRVASGLVLSRDRSSHSEEEVVNVYQPSTDQVFRVDSTTTQQLGSPMSRSEFELRSENNIKRNELYGRAMRDSSISAAGKHSENFRQFDNESNSFVAGNNLPEMARDLGATSAGTFATVELSVHAKNPVQVGAAFAGGEMVRQVVANGEVEHAELASVAFKGAVQGFNEQGITSILGGGKGANTAAAAVAGGVQEFDKNRDRIIDQSEGSAGAIYGAGRVAQRTFTLGLATAVYHRTGNAHAAAASATVVRAPFYSAAAVYPAVKSLDEANIADQILSDAQSVTTSAMASQDALRKLSEIRSVLNTPN